MSEIFQTPLEIVTDMLVDHEAISGIALSPTDYSREEVIKYWVVAGAISMARSTARRVFDDFFPRSASVESLLRHLASRNLQTRILPQKSSGVIRHTGVNGTAIGLGTQVKRRKDGAIFQSIQSGVIASGFIDLTYESVDTGSVMNLDRNDQPFDMVTIIAGVDAAATNKTNFLSGRDIESQEEMIARIEAHDQDDNSGGNLVAYEAFARAASPQVVTAKAIKQPRGGGTVDTVITSGTTDIESAVRNGDPVSRLPSAGLIATVQAYIVLMNPTTDDHQTIGPTEIARNVTINFDLYDETQRPSVAAEIEILTKVFLYEALPTNILHPTELERRIDRRVGHLVKARRVADLGDASTTYTVPPSNLLIPGVITLGTM